MFLWRNKKNSISLAEKKSALSGAILYINWDIIPICYYNLDKKVPSGGVVSAPDFESQGHGLESLLYFIAQSLSLSPFHRLDDFK